MGASVAYGGSRRSGRHRLHAAPPMSIVLSIAFHATLFVVYAVLLWQLPILTTVERMAIRQRLERAIARKKGAV